MAKTPAKPAAKAPAKKAPAKSKAKSAVPGIEKVSEEVLAKLRTLNIEHGLQADIEWCLGSYRADNNPIGLYDMISRALPILKAELEKKTKGVTAKIIGEMEKLIESK